MLVLDAREHELVSRGMEDLTVYADYHDGAPVRYLGVFDFRRSEGRAATEEEAALLGEPEDGDGGSVYRPVIRLLSDWEVQFIDSDTRRVYRLSLEDVTVDPREDPFSGQI